MPPPTLVETPGAANANTYATLAEAEVFMSARLNAATWIAATDEVKNASLLAAALLLDSVMCWTGSPADAEVQALTWPRSGMTNRNGAAIASSVVPVELKNAQCELARQLHLSDITATNEVATQGITGIKAGPVELKFQSTLTVGSPPQIVNPQPLLPPAVVNMLVPSWICDDWVNAQTPPEQNQYDFYRFPTDTDE